MRSQGYDESSEMLKTVVHRSMLPVLHEECQCFAYSEEMNYLRTHRRFGIKKIKERVIADYFHHSFDNIGAFCAQTKPMVLSFPSL